ncbi:hypothetical protein Tco_0966562 [Tanacetum coccineum]
MIWKPPKCACCKVFGHVLEECPKNCGAGATKNLKKTSQTPKEIPVGQKMGFKPKQVFQPVSKKMNYSESTKEIPNSADKETINVSSSNTHIVEKIDKIERQILEGKLRFMDDDGNPIVPTGIVDSDSEVEVVFDETANLRLSTSGKDGSDKGYELDNAWYRGHLYGMYGQLNPHQIQDIATELKNHEQLIILYDEFADLQAELAQTQKNARAKEDDLKVSRMINKLCVKLSAAIEEHRMFTQELEASPGWVII